MHAGSRSNFQVSSKMPSASYEKDGSFRPHENTDINGAKVGSYTNGYDDPFQHRPKPQQNVLLLHGPGQKYSLHKTGQVPELRSEREILIKVHGKVLTCGWNETGTDGHQVVAIGLNPVDWKGPYARTLAKYKWHHTYQGESDYNFGIPSLPWVNGRDFAGIVVETDRSVTRVKPGDVV